MTLDSPVFCTVDEVERKFGADALREFSDHEHDDVRNLDVIHDAINEATAEIFGYLGTFFSMTALAANRQVNRWAIVLACYHLATCRGNPPPETYDVQRAEIIARLEKIAMNPSLLPGVAMRSDQRPCVSNIRIDRRYRQTKQRVEREGSSEGTTELRQNTTEDFPSYLP